MLFVVSWSTRFVGHSMWKYSNWGKNYKKREGQCPGFPLIVSLWMHCLTSLVFRVICLVSLWGQQSRCSQWQESLEVISPGADTYVGLGAGKVGIFWFTSLLMCKWVLTSSGSWQQVCSLEGASSGKENATRGIPSTHPHLSHFSCKLCILVFSLSDCITTRKLTWYVGS